MGSSNRLHEIKRISIREYLSRRGIAPKTEKPGYGMYLSPLREERTPSFKVDWQANLWHDFGTGEGGSIIDLVARMEGGSVAEAIGRLENDTLSSVVPDASFGLSYIEQEPQPSATTPNKSRIEILSVGQLEHRRLSIIYAIGESTLSRRDSIAERCGIPSTATTISLSGFATMPEAGN